MLTVPAFRPKFPKSRKCRKAFGRRQNGFFGAACDCGRGGRTPSDLAERANGRCGGRAAAVRRVGRKPARRRDDPVTEAGNLVPVSAISPTRHSHRPQCVCPHTAHRARTRPPHHVRTRPVAHTGAVRPSTRGFARIGGPADGPSGRGAVAAARPRARVATCEVRCVRDEGQLFTAVHGEADRGRRRVEAVLSQLQRTEVGVQGARAGRCRSLHQLPPAEDRPRVRRPADQRLVLSRPEGSRCRRLEPARGAGGPGGRAYAQPRRTAGQRLRGRRAAPPPDPPP